MKATLLHRLRRRRRGAALLFTLSTLVLLTGVIIAFFQQARLNRQVSFSYTQTAQADMLARTALDIVVGEVRKEALVAIGNDAIAIPTQQGVRNADAEVGAFTILKMSDLNGVISPDEGRLLGSAVQLDEDSVRRRNNSNWFTDGPNLGTASLPTWVYMTRSNGPKTPSVANGRDRTSDDYVVGRFAFTVYNTAGMLDANVVGYPYGTGGVDGQANTFAMPAEKTGTKTSITYADLREVGFAEEEIDTLVSWRNASLFNAEDDSGVAIDTDEKIKRFDEWATGLPRTEGEPHEASLEAFRSGRTQLVAGDNAFFSRGDLRRYIDDNFGQNAPPGFLEEVLGALTHFSRAKTLPSWGPQTPEDSSINYAGQADERLSANRNIANLVVEEDTEVRLYNDDGTFEPITIEEGDQFVQRRFSLAKLAWLGHDGPNEEAFDPTLDKNAREEAIKYCFGLEWEESGNAPPRSSNSRWKYDHGDPNNILTLAEVLDLPPNRKRLPDFFELLKAGILEGSLGLSPGAMANDISSSKTVDKEGPIGRHFERYSSDPTRHVFQIGANIIDQADRDNYPTAIYAELFGPIGGSGSTTEETEFFNTVFGQENLPMLQRIGVVLGPNQKERNETDYRGEMAVWFQPELYNPHHPATADGSPDDEYPTPASLRVVTYGGVQIWNNREDKTMSFGNKYMSTPIDFGRDYTTPIPEGTLYFENIDYEDSSHANFFTNPKRLNGYEYSLPQNDFVDSDFENLPQNRYPEGAQWEYLGKASLATQFIGVQAGVVLHEPNEYTNSLGEVIKAGINMTTLPQDYLSFVLEYFDGDEWRPYSMLVRWEQMKGYGGGAGSRLGQQGAPWLSNNGHIDPRTDRLSGTVSTQRTGANPGWWPGRTIRAGPNDAVNKGAQDGRGPVTAAVPRPGEGFTNVLGSGNDWFPDTWAMNDPEYDTSWNHFYEDADDVIRPGDAFRSDLDSGEGVVSFSMIVSKALDPNLRRRPVILNRPFRSVGELGYVYRDLPFKTLDMWSDLSADAGLLDLFSVSQKKNEIYIGDFDPSSSPDSVMLAVLTGASKDIHDSSIAMTSEEAGAVAAVLQEDLGTEPLRDPSDLVLRLSEDIWEAFSNAQNDSGNNQIRNKTYAETPVRALAGNTTNRIWNLMIDVVAQSGRLTSSASSLGNFIVEGEKRYWLHLAIDRETGDIVDSQLESRYE